MDEGEGMLEKNDTKGKKMKRCTMEDKHRPRKKLKKNEKKRRKEYRRNKWIKEWSHDKEKVRTGKKK